MKIYWILALIGALALIVLLVLLELGVLKSPGASVQIPQITQIPQRLKSSLAAGEAGKLANVLKPADVYRLTQQGLVGKEALAQFVKSPLLHFEHTENPHSVGAYKYREEVALRVSALEALDRLAIKNPTEIQKILEEIAKIQQDPTLQFLVRISLEGIYSKRPGKLSRTMDEMIAEKKIIKK